MKRFSVLLVVLAFLMPLVVYGLSGNMNLGSTDRGLVPDSDSAVRRSFQKDAKGSTESVVMLQNQEDSDFIFVRGTVASINTGTGVIELGEAAFFQLEEQHSTPIFGFLQIKFNSSTNFFHGDKAMPDSSHLSKEMVILCRGKISNTEQKMESTDSIISGLSLSQIGYDPKEEVFSPPPGTKGTIVKVDQQNNIIYLENVTHDDMREPPVFEGHFEVRLHPSTSYNHDAQSVPDFSHLSIGMEVICQGRVNYARGVMDYTSALYSGLYYSPDSYSFLHFSGPVKEVDIENNQLVVYAETFPSQKVKNPFIIQLESSTTVWERIYGSSEGTLIENGVIPQNFKAGMMISGYAKFYYGNSFCTAVDIMFMIDDN